jgi:hypothetical protein
MLAVDNYAQTCAKTIHWWPHVFFEIPAITMLTFSKNMRAMDAIIVQPYSPGTAQHLEALIVQCTRHQQTSNLASQPSLPWPTGQGLLLLLVQTCERQYGVTYVLCTD